MQPSSLSTLLIAAGYMVVAGIIGLIWPLLRLGPNHPEFQARSLAYRVGAQTSELILSAAFIVAGVGLFWHHGWARKLSLPLLLIRTIYSANEFAWGFAGGQPTRRVHVLSLITVAAWNGLWFYLIYRIAL